MSINYIFFFFVLELVQSHIVIKFNRMMSIIKEQNYSLDLEYVNQRIDNPYTTILRFGDPSQYIPSFLKTDEYSFYLSNYNCPKSVFIYKTMSQDLIYITPEEYFEEDDINEYHFLDSIFLEETINNSNFSLYKLENCSITVDNNMKGPQCFHIGTQVKLQADETGNNLIDILFKKNYIKSYLYEFKIINDDEMHLNIGLKISDKDIQNYKFIKPISIYYSEYYNNKIWGLNFDKIYLKNYPMIYNPESNVELDINVGCILGNTDFHGYFKNYLKSNNIFVEPKIGEQEYYFYFFDKNIPEIEIIKNFEITFYYKDLNYNFTLNFEDLFIEKRFGYYFLIAFEKKFRPNWKFGYPFFKKYKFIFDFDLELIGFSCINGCQNTEMKESNYNFKKFIIILGNIFGSIVILLIGILLGKKLYEEKKARANELLDLYEYKENEKSEIKKEYEKIEN